MKKPLSEMSLEDLWKLFPIILKEHSPDYFIWYITEKSEIEKTLNPNIIKRISHIGSTAVKDLIAKPIVDILLEIDEICVIEQLEHKLESIGWILMSFDSNLDIMSFNKGYTSDGFAEKVFHLHIRHFGDWDELYFRDYLTAHNEISEEYARLKHELALKYKHNRDAYTEAKSDFVQKYSKLAREEFGNRYK